MTLSRILRGSVRRAIRRAGYDIIRLSPEEQAVYAERERLDSTTTLASVFGPELAKLDELRARYSRVKLPIALHSVWGARAGASGGSPDIGHGGLDLRYFRSDNAYVWSYATSSQRLAKLTYFIFMQETLRKDSMRLLQRLREDGAFGCLSVEFDGGGRISRDLLESVIELNFLHRHWGILTAGNLRVLDIGAGYGRLAHRMLEATDGVVSYTCVDAVPESTFLSDFYLRHRGLGGCARVLPMDELEQQLRPGEYDLALNVHSFSECTYTAVDWWLRKVREIGVRRLMIVPNDERRFLTAEADGTRRDFAPLLKELGYRIVATEPVYDDPLVRRLTEQNHVMFLFESEA